MSAGPFNVVYFGDRFLVPGDEAKVSATDRGYLVGEGIFASMRGYGGVCFRAERHLAIFARGAAMFDLTLPHSCNEIGRLADEAAKRTGAADAYVRVTLTRGEGAAPILSIVARPFDVPTDDDFARGIAAVTVGPRRFPPACLDGTIKTTSYAPQLLARREAAARGAREGVQLAIDGSVACGAMSNVFVVSRDVLSTPPLSTGCRAGVTRDAILEIAPKLGLGVREETVEPATLLEADEAFFTSTRVECLPIASIDGRATRARAFPRTTALRAALRELIRHEGALR
ncbi:MAG: aminotransferase class IV [Labilithrix sp.]|nr:aminotransferase class IV [Labilithrix sp.]